MGSCFARNIEEHLIYAGQDVLSKKIVSPRDEYPLRTNGFVNKFTTHSMLQEAIWLEEPPKSNDEIFVETSVGWVDMHLGPCKEVSFERVVERRRYLASEYFPRIAQASVLILTLGLNEVWLDNQSGQRINVAPSLWTTRKHSGRFVLEVTSAQENVDALEELRSRLRRINPALRIILTVSPVPMAETFRNIDVGVANTLSKAVLRAAAEQFCNNHDDTDYFPSFEMVTMAPRHLAYWSDLLHVENATVSEVINRFMLGYLGKPSASPAGYIENLYLWANPDIEDLVRLGELRSGYEHWIEAGCAEGRPLQPDPETLAARRPQ